MVILYYNTYKDFGPAIQVVLALGWLLFGALTLSSFFIYLWRLRGIGAANSFHTNRQFPLLSVVCRPVYGLFGEKQAPETGGVSFDGTSNSKTI